MKKILLTILTVFYLAVSSGAAVHFHYCMGKLVSWGLAEQTGNICHFCGMPKAEAKKKSCCGDVETQAKVEKSQKASQTIYQFSQCSSAITQPELFIPNQSQIPAKVIKEALSNAPPDGQQVPVFIKNCTYLI